MSPPRWCYRWAIALTFLGAVACGDGGGEVAPGTTPVAHDGGPNGAEGSTSPVLDGDSGARLDAASTGEGAARSDSAGDERTGGDGPVHADDAADLHPPDGGPAPRDGEPTTDAASDATTNDDAAEAGPEAGIDVGTDPELDASIPIPVGPDASADAGHDAPTAPRWPVQRTSLPACTTSPRPFVAPALAAPSGEVTFAGNAAMEPVGYDVRVGIEVRSPSTLEVDSSAAGLLALTSDGAITWEQPVTVTAGRAEVVVRFATAGIHTLRATMADGRSGTIQVEAFVSQLPIWELAVIPAEMDAVLADTAGSLKAAAGVTVGGASYTGRVRLHGGSSRYYPKQSLRVELASGQRFGDGSSHAVFRAEWNDKTMLRNYLSSEVMQNGTWLPSFRAEPIHLRVNQRYYGLMLRTQRVDRDFLAAHGLSVRGSLYEADPPLAVSVPGGNLTPLASRDAYRLVYQLQAGRIDYDDLIALIEQTLTLPETAFRAEIENQVAVDDALAFLAGMAVIQNHDHVRKNYYLYRDPDHADARWRLLPWDLDLTFGHLYSDEANVLDERIFTDELLHFGERVPAHDFYNQLTTRLLAVPAYRARFAEYAKHIAYDVLSDEFIEGRIAAFLCRTTPELLADSRKRASDDEYLGRVDEIRTFIRARRAFIAHAAHGE